MRSVCLIPQPGATDLMTVSAFSQKRFKLGSSVSRSLSMVP